MRYILLALTLLISSQLHSRVAYDSYKSKSYFVKKSLLLNEQIYAGKKKKRVKLYTCQIFDTWFKYRLTKLRYIKNPKIAIALVHSESNFNPRVVSVAGCIGLFQLDIKTARWICKKYGISSRDLRKRLYDPNFNILVGLCNLNEELKNAKGRVDIAILSYKCGSGTVRRNEITRRHIDLYSRFYCYSKFIDGDPKFKNPKKYFYMFSTYLHRV